MKKRKKLLLILLLRSTIPLITAFLLILFFINFRTQNSISSYQNIFSYQNKVNTDNLKFIICFFIILFNAIISLIYKRLDGMIYMLTAISFFILLLKELFIKNRFLSNLFIKLFIFSLILITIVLIIDLVRFIIYKTNKNNKIVNSKKKIEILNYIVRYKILRFNK